MRVAVIGSGGFLGRRLCQVLSTTGCEAQEVSSTASGGIDPVSGRLSPDFSLRPGTDAVVYLSQSPHYQRLPEMSWHVWNVNVTSAVAVAQSASAAGVKRFVYASTGSVYAPQFGPLAEQAALRRDRWYPLSKLHAEESLSLLGKSLEIVAVRPFGIYGPGQSDMLLPRLMQRIASGQEVTVDRNPHDARDSGGLRLSLCYVDDAAELMARLLSVANPPPVMNLASRESPSIREIAESIGEQLEQPVLLDQRDSFREGNLIADTNLLEATTGLPMTTFAEGIRRTVDAWRRSPRAASAAVA